MVFATTRWTNILKAGANESRESDSALEELCDAYWRPVYAFARKSGNPHQEAEDVTQAFFLRLIEKKFHLSARPERGRFRTFLLASFKNFLTNRRRDAARQKRGGGMVFVNWDFVDCESGLADELKSDCDPEVVFQRSWTRVFLDRVTARIRQEYEEEGLQERFEILCGCLENPEETPKYSVLAERLALSESGVKSAVSRMRQRFRTLCRMEIGEIVVDSSMIEDEMRSILAAF